MSISDRSGINLIYRDIAVGEVWLAGGQSNMEFELANAAGGKRMVAESKDPFLRFFNTPKFGRVDETLLKAEDASSWAACSSETTGCMSAIAYCFARKLRQEMETAVPVGIIGCYVGGTSISCWMSEKTLANSAAGRGYLERYHDKVDGKTEVQMHEEMDAWRQEFDCWNANVTNAQAAQPDMNWETLNDRYGECPWPPPMTTFSQYHPAGPYTAMLKRLAPYEIRGFLWYHGEEDEQYCDSYEKMLHLLIDEWRILWSDSAMRSPTKGNPSLPFVIAQLPQWISKKNYDSGVDPMLWPVLREAQWNISQTVENIYTSILMDCGEFDNIHPKDKCTPGCRLAKTALAKVYNRSDILSDGPIPILSVTSLQENRCGTVVRITFAHAHGLHFQNMAAGTAPQSGTESCAKHLDKADGASAISNMIRASDESGFEIAGEDNTYYPATARILGISRDELMNGSLGNLDAILDGGTTIIDAVRNSIETSGKTGIVELSSPIVTHPVWVRYGWFSWGPAPLFNADDLPAVPFCASLAHKHQKSHHD